MMKIIIPGLKPRAKRLNDLLMSKRCSRHEDPRNPSRSKQKQAFRRELSNS